MLVIISSFCRLISSADTLAVATNPARVNIFLVCTGSWIVL